MRHHVRHHGFTLLELLVVIAIIALLAAIMVPALARARSASLMLVCTTHVREIARGCLLYANDYDGTLPYTWLGVPDGTANYQEAAYGPWWDRVGGYCPTAPGVFTAYLPFNPIIYQRTVWTCPFVDRGELAPPWRHGDSWSMQYAMNDNVMGLRNAHTPAPGGVDWIRLPRRLTTLRSDLPLISDSAPALYESKYYFLGNFTAKWQGQVGDWDNLAPWEVDRATGRVLLHDGQIPLGLVDGSVATVSSITPDMLELQR